MCSLFYIHIEYFPPIPKVIHLSVTASVCVHVCLKILLLTMGSLTKSTLFTVPRCIHRATRPVS